VKKLLVVLLALTFVVAMATAAFAVTTSSVDGKVEVTLTGSNLAEGHVAGVVDGEIHFDLAKDYGEGYKAGLVITADPDEANKVIFDGAGWIEITKDWAVITVKTSINGNAANELGGKCDMVSAPGVQIVNTSLMEGLTLTGIFNENAISTGTPAVLIGEFWNYLVKAVYAKDALTVGVGYQAHSVPALNEANKAFDSMAVWAGYKISDSMSAGLEYASRPNVGVDGTTAIMAKFSYSADPLTVNAKYITVTDGWVSEDAEAWNFFKCFMNAGVEGGYLGVDATYKISDPLSVYAKIEDVMYEGVTDGNMLIKAGATYKLSDAISVDGNYTMINTTLPSSKIVVTVTDTLVAGLVASLELKSETILGLDPVNTYTAKITATL